MNDWLIFFAAEVLDFIWMDWLHEDVFFLEKNVSRIEKSCTKEWLEVIEVFFEEKKIALHVNKNYNTEKIII